MSSLMPMRNSSVAPHISPRMPGLVDYQHHVKNLMAVIRSIAARTAENSSSLEEFMAHFDGRLAALGRMQRMLARSNAFEIDLEELVREELLAPSVKQAVQVEGPAARLPQKVAENLALAIHELVTNAIKFGALSGQGGRLSVTWKASNDELRLEWRERGVATLDPSPKHSGFGREWLEKGLGYQLGATAQLDFLPGGFCCIIVLPLALIALEVGP